MLINYLLKLIFKIFLFKALSYMSIITPDSLVFESSYSSISYAKLKTFLFFKLFISMRVTSISFYFYLKKSK